MDEPKEKFSGLKKFYETKYKQLLIIPFALLIIAIILIVFQGVTTGDIMNKDVSLKGGVTVTVHTSEQKDLNSLKSSILLKFPESDVSTKTLSQLGSQVGVIIEADITQDKADELITEISSFFGKELKTEDYTVEVVGSSLGASFFKDLSIAILIAFLFMAFVVFIYFRTFIPSLAVILAALSDILITLAIVNLMGMKLSAAGIASFLMLIGYSVDTDILLSTRLLKRREGSEMERIYGAMRTGLTMSATTIVAVTVALIISQSEVIRQIMTILLIGLFVDLINTWIQNVGILRLYLEKKSGRNKSNE